MFDVPKFSLVNVEPITDPRHERLRLLYQVSNVIHSTLDSQEALQLIVSEAVRVMRASSAWPPSTLRSKW